MAEFQQSRPQTFDEFMKSLRAANKGHLFNNFNMFYMSMPLECSPQNNFWLAYCLQAHVDH